MRAVIVGQEKGGTGKSLLSQGLAVMAPSLSILEIEESRRLLGLADRVRHFGVSATNEALELSGGSASLEWFDPFIDALAGIEAPVVVDVGANTARRLFGAISNVGSQLRDLNIEIATLLVVTSEPGAIAAIPMLTAESETWAAARFLVENRLHNAIPSDEMASLSKGAVVTVLSQHRLSVGAAAIVNAAGLSSIEHLDPTALGRTYGLAKGQRIERDLARLKLDVCRAVEPAARWLVS
jgi:hypothetical protein